MSQFFINALSEPGIIDTITGNTGGPQGPINNNFTIVTANATPKFVGTSGTETLDFGLTNLLLGSSGSSISVASSNVAYGLNALNSLTSGAGNTFVGVGAGELISANSDNTGIGYNALQSLNSGSIGENVAIGAFALSDLSSGQNNIAIGQGSGEAYTSSESSNILIGTQVGIIGDANTIRIGFQGSSLGEQNKCFIAGIVGVTTSNPQLVTINSSTGQLGVTTAQIGTWIDESTSFNVSSGNGYFITNTATATLPPSPSQGDSVSFIVDTTNILTIQANTGQFIRVGTDVSASAGTCASSNRGDAIEFVYRLADTTWLALGSAQGTWGVT